MAPQPTTYFHSVELQRNKCQGCVSCVKVCPVQAIDFYLGADMGGRGSTMNVTADGHYLHWHIHKADGSEKTITVDRKQANSY